MTGSGVTLLDWRPIRRGTLYGFSVVRIDRIGLVVADVAVHQKNQSRWGNLPSKPMLDRTGNLMREAAGKLRYSPVNEWPTNELRNEFSRRVAAMVKRANPRAFDPDRPDFHGQDVEDG